MTAIVVREQVLQAFLQAITAVSQAITPLMVARNRDTEVQKYPALIQVDGPQHATEENSGFTRYDMQVMVQGFVQAQDATTISAAYNELYGQTVKAALADRTLGGLCTDITEISMDLLIDRTPGRPPVTAFEVTFVVNYSTAFADPYTTAP